MATPEDVRKKNLEESNELLAESLDLTAKLADQMNYLYKNSKEKYTQDKLAVDLTKQAVFLTKNLSSEYKNVKEVEKDLAKNQKLQNEIARTSLNLEKEIGEKGKMRIQFIKNQEKGLTKSKELLSELREKEAAGVAGAKEQAEKLSLQIMSRQRGLATQLKNLSAEERQYMLLQQTSKALDENNEYLSEQLRRQENLVKNQSLFTAAIIGTDKALNKLGFGDLSKKLGLDAARKKAEEMTYVLTEGGKKSLGMFGKLRVATASFGAALKSALGPLALLGMAVSLFNKFKEIGKEAADAMNAVEQNTKNLGRELGISDKKAAQVASSAMKIGSAMGVTTDIAISSAKSIYTSLDGAEQVSSKTLDTFMRLNVFAGMSADSLAGIYKFSKLSGEEASKVAENIATTARESIKSMKVNVSMKSVMEGVSKVSNIMKLNFNGSAEGLTKAFIQSKKLGLELGKVEDIANSLLNIEDSIAAEMEAELLTGKDLNLEKAREAALNNNTAGLMEEISKQFGSIEDYQKMNRVQQEAFAKSIGMSREGLADMLVTSKENKATNTGLVDTQQQSLKAMQSMASVAEKIAAQEEAKKLAASETGQQYNRLQMALNNIATKGMEILNQIFAPIGEVIADIVTKVSNWLGKEENLKMLSEGVSSIFSTIKSTVTFIWGVIQPLVEAIGNLALNLLPTMSALWEKMKPTIEFIGGIISNIVGFVAKLITDIGIFIGKLGDTNKKFTTMEKVVGSIAFIVGGMIGLSQAILAINKLINREKEKSIALMIREKIAEIGNFFKSMGTAIAKLFSGFGVLGPFGVPLAIAAVAGLSALAYSFFNKGDDVLSPGSSSNGYGNRVLYGPEGAIALNNKDTVVAGTNLFKGDDVVSAPKGAVNMNTNNDALIAEMKEIKVLLSQLVNKQGDVLLDGTKVGKSLMLAGYQM